MSATPNNPPAPDWLSLTEEDSSWLNSLDIDDSIKQSSDDDVEWLSSSLSNTVGTGGTTLSIGAPSHAIPSEIPKNLDNLFEDVPSLPQWEAIGSDSNIDHLLGDLDSWEIATPGDEYNDWTDVPTSTSELARQEAQDAAAWDEKDQFTNSSTPELDYSETAETKDFSAPIPYDFSYSSPPAEDFQHIFDDRFSPPASPVQESEQTLQQSQNLEGVFDQIISEPPSAEDYDPQTSEFHRASYLDNFELDPSAISAIDIDLDLDDFRNSAIASTPPLHETFSASGLPPLPPKIPSEPITDGDKKWTNRQMSTGLNPDRKPFESAPPSLITGVSKPAANPTKAPKASFDIYDLEENTDWSGLLQNETAVDKEEIAPAPVPVPPLPQRKAPAPPPPPVPEAILHREVQQFQELLDDSNLSAALTPDQEIQQISPVEDSAPLHSRITPPKAQFTPPKIAIPSLPWAQIGKFAGIGIGAIALLWGGSVVLDRPITEVGLRMGIWKDVSGKDLRDMNLENGNLRGADLSKANLQGAKLAKADLSITNLSETDLTGADLTKATIRGANLQGTKIGKPGTKQATKMDREAYLVWQSINERLDGLNMSRLNLLGANFNSASLIKANFTNSNLSFATFRGANLTGATLRGANLESADFSDANLTGVNMQNATFGKPPTSSEATICPNRQKGPCQFDKFR